MRRTIFLAGTAVTLGSLCLYVLTLAPTVLWGDDAELQRLAFTGGTPAAGRSYPLWLTIAHGFTHLPFGDVAWRANLVSATFAAATVGGVFATIACLTRSTFAAWVGSLALAVSHTFWLHAVRAEVYSLYLALLTGIVLLLVLWHRHSRVALLVGALLLTGLALPAHPLILTALPAIALFIWLTPKPHPRRTYAWAIVAAAAGLLPYLLLGDGQPGPAGASLPRLWAGLTSLRGRDIVLWAGFLGYQFLLTLPLGLSGLARLWQTERRVLLFLGLVFLGNVGFALVFHVPDQYVFYLPSYLVFAIWVGLGAAALPAQVAHAPRWVVWTGVVLVVVLVPVATYRLTPILLNRLGIELLAVRSLPNRDTNTFFLDPPKHGYDGARVFGETVLRDLPPDAALLADWSPLQTLRYLQEVEGRRPDVLLAEIRAGTGEQAAWLVEQSRERPVFIADTGRYYDMPEIEALFRVYPFSYVYRLDPILRDHS